MTQIGKFLDKPTNLMLLVRRLSWDEDEFEEAVREQPSLYLEASRYRALKARRLKRAEFSLSTTTAETKTKLRTKRDKGGRKLLTEPATAETATIDPAVVVARKKLDEAYVQDELAKSLMEAYRQRGQMLKIVADIRASEVASEIRNVRENLARDDMRNLSDRVRSQFAGKKKHPLAGRPEYRDDRGRLPHADNCRSNRGGPCNCGRGM